MTFNKCLSNVAIADLLVVVLPGCSSGHEQVGWTGQAIADVLEVWEK